ncbi:uncharacterized protein LOC130444604 [Diorhabda sublineata]|uniref:uncharacterized protein LOC130444604 n=1 Tax=Diorhabda sublineata TaxID=1163346 RepID=UPI0024E12BD1|nr:uncharacterized protein LOC130444604 [Diorhabda sublineata]
MEQLSNNGSSLINQTSICSNMRELIEAINEYIKTKTDSSTEIINKFLQAYSVTIDVSTFDPENGLGAQFYVSLYNLFTNLDPHSQMAWDCVDVLSNACRNSSARQALIDTYQFVPPLSRLLNDQLNLSKRKKVLILLQDLTCGIKLSWQVSYLPHLLKILTKWVESKDQDIVCLSLSVLVNLCFKNISVMYTLSRIVDIKKFLRFCLPLQGPLIEIHVCKLMIILNHLNDDIPKNTLLHLVSPTFNSMQESLAKNDAVMLRSVVDFFVDITSENKDIFKEYKYYTEQIDDLIKTLMSRKIPTNADSTPIQEHDPECIVPVLKFIHAIEDNKITDLSSLYSSIIKLALEWVQNAKVTYESNILLTIITQNLSEIGDNKSLLNMLSIKLPTFLTLLGNESSLANMDACRRLRSVLQLLRVMLKATPISEEVMKSLTEPLLMGIFSPVLSDDFNSKKLSLLKVNEDTTTSTEYVDVYVCGIGLVYELAQHNADWLEMLSMLMENRNIQSIIAIALYGSKSHIRQLVLELSRYSRFPIAKIAEAMETSQNMFCNKTSSNNHMDVTTSHNSGYPVLGYGQLEMVDDTLNSLKKLINDQQISNISVCQVMELYEYKLASLANSELSASNSLQAASERCVHLQHRITQLSSEHNKLGQLIHHYESKLEKNQKSMNDLKTFCLNERKNADKEIEKWEETVKEREGRLNSVKQELLHMTKLKDDLEEQIKKNESLIQKLEENGNRVEKQLQSREQQLKNANSHIDDLNVQIKDLRKMLDQKETKLADVTKHYLATKEVLNTITRVATSQMNSERQVI